MVSREGKKPTSNRLRVGGIPHDGYAYYRPSEMTVFEQVRDDSNPAFQAMKRDIGAIGLLHAVSGLVTNNRKLLEEYRAFTEKTWVPETRHPIRTIRTEPIEDVGKHVLLIAGHSRREIVRQLSREQVKAGGQPMSLETKRFRIASVAEIVAIQAGENISSNPPADRTARAFAESFLWERALDPTLTKKDFIEKSGFSRHALDRALAYTALPEWVRGLVRKQDLPFSVSYEVARFYTSITQLRTLQETDKLSIEEIDEEVAEKIWQDVNQETIHAIATYNGKANGRVLRAVQILRAEINIMEELIDDCLISRGLSEPKVARLLTLMPQYDRERRRREIIKELAEFKRTSGERAHSLHSKLVERMEGYGEDEVTGDIAKRLLSVAADLRESGFLDPLTSSELNRLDELA